MKKRILTFSALLLCLVMLLSSCRLEGIFKETTELEETEATKKTTATKAPVETTEPVPTTEETVIPSETAPPVEGAPEYLDTLPLNDYAILFLEMEYNETDVDTFTGRATYDMNGDSTIDDIRIEVDETTMNLNVLINGVSTSMTIDYVNNAFLIDIDRGDNYVDLFVQDSGASDDPVSHIFRYDGTSIIHLGDIFGSLRCNRQGQIISWEGFSWYTYPVMVYSWLEIVSGSIIYHTGERDMYIGQTFGFKREIGNNYGAWMEETTTIPAYDACPYGAAATNIIVPAGYTFTILDVSEFSSGTSPNWYYIQLEDGRTGVFYYMKGD